MIATLVECITTCARYAAYGAAGLAFLTVASYVGGILFVWVLRATNGFGAGTATPSPPPPATASTTGSLVGEGDEALSFLPDSDLSASLLFRAAKAITLYPARAFWGLSVSGIEGVDPSQAYLFVTLHSSHNHDIFASIFAVHDLTGRAARSLIHRLLATALPWLRFLGSVPGYRTTAVNLLKSGFWVAVIPGGVGEAMAGYDAAYSVNWPESRVGFAKVAAAAGVPIVPVVTENSEEMKFAPLFWLWSKIGGGVLFDAAVKIPYLGPVVHTIGICAWFAQSWFSIWIPVQTTIHIGTPIPHDPDRTLKDTVDQTKSSLRALIAQHQPHRLSYLNGIRKRWHHLFPSS